MSLYQKSLLIIVCIALLGFGSIGTWMFFKSEFSGKEAGSLSVSAKDLMERTVETETITTNLYGGGWIKIRFAIEADSAETKERLEQTMFQTKSIIIRILSQLDRDKLTGENGLKIVEDAIQDKLNEALEGEKIVKVYTTDRIIQ